MSRIKIKKKIVRFFHRVRTVPLFKMSTTITVPFSGFRVDMNVKLTESASLTPRYEPHQKLVITVFFKETRTSFINKSAFRLFTKQANHFYDFLYWCGVVRDLQRVKNAIFFYLLVRLVLISVHP
jgi:hypothetical protein